MKNMVFQIFRRPLKTKTDLAFNFKFLESISIYSNLIIREAKSSKEVYMRMQFESLVIKLMKFFDKIDEN